MSRKILSILILMIGISVFNSCTKDYASLNSDPSVVTETDIKYLLTYSENQFQANSQSEWLYDSFEMALRYSQLIVSDAVEPISYNSRYSLFYNGILPNLVEIRRLINLKADKDKYQSFAAVTNILQIVHGLKVTDMDGSIPYTEAMRGRSDSYFTPKYDAQKLLYDTWLTELNSAITTLKGSSADQQTPGSSDIYFAGDWTKWIKLANTIKLRIAARYQGQDAAKAKSIFNEVMTEGTLMNSEADQMIYSNPDFSPFGVTEIDYRSRRYASETVVDFMKATNDPRLVIYYEPNSLVGTYQAKLTAAGVALPAFINPADPKIFIQGAPANKGDNTKLKNQFYTLKVGAETFALISPINRHFFSPKIDGASGVFKDVMVSYAETCFYIAEFIQKGYSTGSWGTAASWYNKGVTSSMITMNDIASVAKSPTGLTTGNPEITAYLNNPLIKLDGTNDLERIYIQQWLNFYRSGNEAFVFVRRTGYPKLTSTYLQWEVVTETIPRRYWLDDPGEVNRVNWTAAQTDQAFTPRDKSLATLNSQRLWFDKTSPDFGKGQ